MIASWFEGYELGQTLGDSGRQGGLACCSPWGHKESDMTERLNKQTTPSPNTHTSANLDPTSKETRRSFDCFTLTVHVCLGTQSLSYSCHSVDYSPMGSSVGSHSLLQEMFPIQGSNLDLQHCRQILYHLSYQGSSKNTGVGSHCLSKGSS